MEQKYKIGYFGRVTHFPNCILVSNWTVPNIPELIRVSFTQENLQSMTRHQFDIGVWKIKKLNGKEYAYHYFWFDKNIPKVNFLNSN